MECNKDEAIRAKEVAERKFTSKDLAGARKFVLKAQSLYPGLDGLEQMIATFDVYIAAENKMYGESDWYGILGVSPQADEDMVRKQYRKLALMLHPDKNKAIGADGAFKLVSEAWSLLSDKAKRSAYDQKRSPGSYNKVSTPSGGSSSAHGSNGFYNFAKSTAKVNKGTSRTSNTHSAPPVKTKPATFWTVCHGCKMQYEYLRVYLNHNLLCPNCHEPFLAVETAPPPINTSSKTSNFTQQQRQNSNQQAPSRNVSNSHAQKTNYQWSPYSRTTAQAASVVHQAYEKVKREREEAQAAQAMKRKKRRGMDDIGSSNYRNNGSDQMCVGSGFKQSDNVNVRVNGITRPYHMTDVSSRLDIQNLLMEKAKTDIKRKLTELNLAKQSNAKKWNPVANGKTSVEPKMDSQNMPAQSPEDGSGSNVKIQVRKKETLSINVPDPDFHDFDKDRTEKCFGENQVWAAYDDDDGMPRYYAMIQEVISVNPFKMRISWLNSKTNSELGPLNWVGSGFSKTCGDFRVGKHEVYSSLNAFSHKVRWTKGTRGVINIYPKKGDVWALYRNWSPNWNELTEEEVIHKYDMVEVLEDYSEEHGVIITPLVKVARFKTVFHQHLDPRKIRRIPREEMFRFSHPVPSYLLSGLESPDAPKGCRDLDPAAIPPELLQVIVDVKEDDIMMSDDMMDSVENYSESVKSEKDLQKGIDSNMDAGTTEHTTEAKSEIPEYAVEQPIA